jgi:hypothetical protein
MFHSTCPDGECYINCMVHCDIGGLWGQSIPIDESPELPFLLGEILVGLIQRNMMDIRLV